MVEGWFGYPVPLPVHTGENIFIISCYSPVLQLCEKPGYSVLDSVSEGDLRLQEVPRPFFWGRDRQQTCLQKVCPGGGPPLAGG